MAYTEYCVPNTGNSRVLLATDIHNCHEEYYHVPTVPRMNLLCQVLEESHKKRPYDLLLCMGDYSLDFWVFSVGGSYLWDPPVSRTKEFVETYVSRFPAPTFLIPGNHEQYGNDTWQEIAGRPREYAVVYGDVVFAMCDTFSGDLAPTKHSDGTYVGLNVEFLQEVLKRHPDKRIFLCAHDIYERRESEAAKTLVRENPQIVCCFAGHIHRSGTVLLDREWGNLPIIYCGDFSYESREGATHPHWGVRWLELSRGVYTEYETAEQMLPEEFRKVLQQR